MRTLSIVSLTLIAALGACAQTPHERAVAAQDAVNTQQKLDAALAGLTPGKPTTCLNNFTSTQLSGYGSTLLYRVSGSLVYRTDTGGGCEGVGRDDILVTLSPTGRLCQGDIARTVDRTSRFPTGGCALGEFIPYTKK